MIDWLWSTRGTPRCMRCSFPEPRNLPQDRRRRYLHGLEQSLGQCIHSRNPQCRIEFRGIAQQTSAVSMFDCLGATGGRPGWQAPFQWCGICTRLEQKNHNQNSSLDTHLVPLAHEPECHIREFFAHCGGAGGLPMRARQHRVPRKLHRQLLQCCDTHIACRF